MLIFSIGTLAWLAVLVVLGARHLLGYGVDGQVALIAAAGVVLGLIGLAWARMHSRRQHARAQSPAPAEPAPPAQPAPGAAGPASPSRTVPTTENQDQP